MSLESISGVLSGSSEITRGRVVFAAQVLRARDLVLQRIAALSPQEPVRE